MRGRQIALALALLGSVVALAGCSVTKSIDPIAGAATKTEQNGGEAGAHGVGHDDRRRDVLADGERRARQAAGRRDRRTCRGSRTARLELRYLEENGDLVLYVNSAELSSRLPGGKPWVRVDLQQLGEKLGVDVGKLLDGANTNPGADPRPACSRPAPCRRSGRRRSTAPRRRTTRQRSSSTSWPASSAARSVRSPTTSSSRRARPRRSRSTSGSATTASSAASRSTTACTVSGQTASVKLQLDVSDYGAVANVTAPPSDQVFDVSGLISSLVH